MFMITYPCTLNAELMLIHSKNHIVLMLFIPDPCNVFPHSIFSHSTRKHRTFFLIQCRKTT